MFPISFLLSFGGDVPLSEVLTLLQAKYLAQIIVMGAQVVGRAFARALQKEYAGMTLDTAHVECTSNKMNPP